MIIDNPQDIETFRLMTLRQMLKLELNGLKASRSNPLAILKKMGYKGTKKTVFEQLSKDLGKEPTLNY
jgi:hypothetical protein